MTGRSDIEQIRDATDLVQLIGEYIALRPRGREHVGLCPFHDDHTPSFSVVTHKNNAFYKCHACGASGDVFTFVERYHKMDFSETLRFLAERAGITLTRHRAESTEPGAPSRTDQRKATSYAADFFRATLQDPVLGAEARATIARRGISAEMTERFMLGAAPNEWDALFSKLRQKPSAVSTALAAGLLKSRNTGDGCYDTFRNRLIFPICDETGTPLAFGGRILDADDSPKYLNSPENAIFNKSKTLYGLNLAKRAIEEANQVIITEGYTDVIACHQAGLTNVVGTMGTALTNEHALILSRWCDSIVLLFDGDSAGIQAAKRSIKIFFEVPVDILICVLPENLDPDALLRQDDGLANFQDAINRSESLMAFLLNQFRLTLEGVESLSGRQKRLETFLGELVDLGFNEIGGIRKRLVMTQLADLLGVSLSDLEASMPTRRLRRGSTPTTAAAGSNAMTETMTWTESPSLTDDADRTISRARRLAERELLALLVYDPGMGCTCRIDTEQEKDCPITKLLRVDHFLDPLSNRIARVVVPWLVEGRTFAMQDLLSSLPDDAARQFASALYFEAQQWCGDDDLAVASQIGRATIVLFEQDRKERLIRAANRLPSDRGDDDAMEGLKQFIQHRRQTGDRPDAILLGIRSSERK